jgi:hypothetical protein
MTKKLKDDNTYSLEDAKQENKFTNLQQILGFDKPEANRAEEILSMIRARQKGNDGEE